jgi:hypothetical protein
MISLHPMAKKMLRNVVMIDLLFILFAMGTGYWNWISAALLGSVFSFLTFDSLIRSQFQFQKAQKKARLLPYILLRIGYVILPVAAAVTFSSYINVTVTVVFLFVFQLNFLLMQALRKRNATPSRSPK